VKKIFIFFILLTFSCGPGTIEEQVESLISTPEREDIKDIAYSLADSVNVKSSELLLSYYPKEIVKDDGTTDIMAKIRRNRIIWGLEDIIYRYSEINNPKIEKCLFFITDPNPDHNLGNNEKLKLISFGLTIDYNSKQFRDILATSALKHNSSGMLALIDIWKSKKDDRILEVLKLFDEGLHDYLVSNMTNDNNSVELLARIGEPVISRMKREMRGSDRNRRFAAGDVLVKMIQYHPDALNALTSAITSNGTRTIARNYPFYIRLGQENTEKILLKALRYNFSTTMCVDYLNCGNSTLESGATKIARDNGYVVTPGFGSHGGPKWGSDN
jgi:hypothetical protein